MTKYLLAAMCVSAAGPAFGAALERSDQNVLVLFEEGNYAEIAFGYAFPSVDGKASYGSGLDFSSGQIADDFGLWAGAIRGDINGRWSWALMVDQPLGAQGNYRHLTYPGGGTRAELDSFSVTGLLQYNFDGGFSLYGGPKVQSTRAWADVYSRDLSTGSVNLNYSITPDRKTKMGYVVGAAYERPELGMRASLTYGSRIEYKWHQVENAYGTPFTDQHSTVKFSSPQYVNFEFQTGISPTTLVLGSVRWVDWDQSSITPPLFQMLTGSDLYFNKSAFTYTLGVGHAFSEKLSGVAKVSYEEHKGGFVTNLGPTDGNWSFLLGGKYVVNERFELSGAGIYRLVGNARTSLGENPLVPGETVVGEFEDNSVFALALKLGFRF